MSASLGPTICCLIHADGKSMPWPVFFEVEYELKFASKSIQVTVL